MDGMQPSAALSADRLSKHFGDRVAFQDVSFEIGYGEVFGFLGPNGAGKTTTVRTLGTLLTPTSGTATVAGLALTPDNAVEIRRRISIMPESPGLYLRLTVLENLRCFADLYQVPTATKRIEHVLSAVHLTDRAQDACGALSKGLRQRVALARALLNDPQVLFLDEPTSGLDPVAARGVHDLIDELRQRGVTIFLTTHRLDEAERLCDRIGIMRGTLLRVDTPAGLRRHGRTATVRVELNGARGPESFIGRLADLKYVSGVQAHDNALVVEMTDPPHETPDLVAELVGAGARITSVVEEAQTLEEAYLGLVGEIGERDTDR